MAFAMFVSAVCLHASSAEPTLNFIEDGRFQGVVVEPDPADGRAQAAMRQFVGLVEKATGAQPPVVKEAPGERGGDRFAVLFGDHELAAAKGFRQADLDVEEYRIVAKDGLLIFQGAQEKADGRRAAEETTTWAVADFADRQLGVRWLWPGELGTYVPRASDIRIPEMAVTRRPHFEKRLLRLQAVGGQSNWGRPETPAYDAAKRSELRREAEAWGVAHRLGDRSRYSHGHAFMDWWDKYHEDYPDVFGRGPNGERVSPYAIKLNVGNEQVDELILREWKQAGAPDNWNLSHNDGSQGWATQPESMALDAPESYAPMAVFKGKVPLTRRYARFWNRILGKMHEVNADASVSVYAYSSLREPPPADMSLNDNIGVMFVPGYDDEARETWMGWARHGIDLGLRPNWWHEAPYSPFLPLHAQLAYFDMARDNGMYGYDFDSVMGDFGVMSPIYYGIARMGARPDLSPEDVIDEYASAFGPASEVIRDYLEFWNRESEALLASKSENFEGVGGFGELKQQLKEKGIAQPRSAHYLPLLFSEGTLAQAREFLDQARKRIREAGPANADEFLGRVDFLAAGLDHFEAAGEVVLQSPEMSESGYGNKPAYMRAFRGLRRLQEDLPDHVVWANGFLSYAIHHASPLYPRELKYLDDAVSEAETVKVLPVEWQFRKDPQNQGLANDWQDPDKADDLRWAPIRTDEFWVRQDVGEDYYGHAWYRIEFTAPDFDPEAPSWLVFNAVDGQTEVWLDGEKLGEQMDYQMWQSPWSVPASGKLVPGEPHTLILRVHKGSKAAGVWRPVEIRVGAPASPWAEPDKVAAVQAGELSTADVRWWGFDPEDSTRFLQAALDSGADTIKVPAMDSPWITEPLFVNRDGLAVGFEKDAVLEAKKGAFRGRGDSLLTVRNRKDIDLRGDGATLRMHKQDYAEDPYRPSGWRHVLAIRGSTNISVRGLTLRRGGGDGIYLGSTSEQSYVKNVVIRDVVCNDNSRQGVSVISAENLLLERCVFSNTSGQNPGAGVDLEPNRSAERLVNVVIRDCLFENNRLGMHMWLAKLERDSVPVSVLWEGNTVRDHHNGYGIGIHVGSIPGDGARGTVVFRDNRVENTANAGIHFRGVSSGTVRFVFENTTLVDTATSEGRSLGAKPPAPVTLWVRREPGAQSQAFGGIEFGNLRIQGEPVSPSAPLVTVGASSEAWGVVWEDVRGTIHNQQPGRDGVREHRASTRDFDLEIRGK